MDTFFSHAGVCSTVRSCAPSTINPDIRAAALEDIMISVSVSVDVPSLEEGIRFYREAFGFESVSEPHPGVAVLRASGAQLLLLAKGAGTTPCPAPGVTRHYDRHWTPVHIDFHVDEFTPALERAISAGATQEHLFEVQGRPSVAFCCDPFGHGFCLIERKKT
jgi:catechol 2,3-dioxygenase-like lactoylglutathione lyase family enzyme